MICELQVGCFDPYSDDPRLGIQKIHLCKYSGYLTVAGTAGQVRSHLVLTLHLTEILSEICSAQRSESKIFRFSHDLISRNLVCFVDVNIMTIGGLQSFAIVISCTQLSRQLSDSLSF